MRLMKNISWMTLSHFVANGAAFLSVPLLITHFGAEAFAAIAFYLAFQMWLVTFDLGFTPALIRELAPRLYVTDKSTGSIVEIVATYRSFFILSASFIIIAFATFFVINHTFERFSSSSFIELSFLVALTGGLRFYVIVEKALYRASELFSRLAVLNATFAIFRYILIFPYMGNSQSLILFFEYQLFIALIEVLFYSLANKKVRHAFFEILNPKFSIIIASKKFIGFSAIAGLMWLAIVNVDKLFLFGNVGDATYSHYTVMLQFASLPMLLLAPISGVVQPRVATLVSDDGEEKLIKFLMTYNAGLAAFVASMAIFIGISFPLFFVIWTGEAIPLKMQGLIILYLMGYAFLSHGLLGYLIQFALKDLRAHGFSHLLLGLFYLPLVAIFSAHGSLSLIAFSWFLMTALLSQAVGFYSASRLLSIRVAIAFFIPAWVIWLLAFGVIRLFDNVWHFSDGLGGLMLVYQNIREFGLLTICTALSGVIIYLALAQLYKKFELSTDAHNAENQIEFKQ